MASVTLPLGPTVVPPLLSSEPQAAADSATPATSRAPTALRSLDLFMDAPFLGLARGVQGWPGRHSVVVFRGTDDTKMD